MMICDPCLFQFRQSAMFRDVEACARTLADVFPASVKNLDIYTNSYTKGVKPIVFRALKEGRTICLYSSSNVDGCFVIKDQSEGKIGGTLFGGSGSNFFPSRFATG
jgi:hypothetical protein